MQQITIVSSTKKKWGGRGEGLGVVTGLNFC